MIDFQNGGVYKLKKVDATKFDKELAELMVVGETVIGAYQDIRDHVVFTDKRVIAVNTQGITGKKKAFTFMPYAKVSVFSIETAGTFDIESELQLYYSGVGKITFEFRGNSDIKEIARIISQYALR